MKEKLQKVQNFVLLVDAWTSRNGKSFVALCIAFIDENWELQVVCLAFRSYTKHTGNELNEIFEAVVKEYGLSEKKWTAVTDRGSDVLKFLKDQNIEHNDCAGHQLHLLLNYDTLKNKECIPIHNLVKKLKRIARALRWKKELLKELFDNVSEQIALKLEDLIEAADKIGM